MAICAKASRIIEFKNQTTPKVGPGSYDIRDGYNKNLNNNAFNSTTKRSFMEPQENSLEADEIVRARNNFSYESNIIKHYLRKPLPNPSFDSNSRRIPDKKKREGPDPGKYYNDPISCKIQKIHNKTAAIEEINYKNDAIKSMRHQYFRGQNKPSIPGKNEKFGYTNYGSVGDTNQDASDMIDMVRNVNPDILPGDHNICVGPGEYNPDNNNLKKHVSAPKMHGGEKEKRFKENRTATGNFIGPGAYNINDMIPNYKFKPSASFQTTGPRSVQEQDVKIHKQKAVYPKNLNQTQDDGFECVPTTIPGPGSYYNPKRDTEFHNRHNKNFKYQLFNTSTMRFGDHKSNSFVGPGAYDIRNKSMCKQTHNTRTIPFNSCSIRDYDKDDKTGGELPGPGYYENIMDMRSIIGKKVELSKRRRARTRSEMPIEKKEENNDKTFDNIGPGTYYDAHNNPKPKKATTNAIFTSNLNRFKTNDKEVPPMGAYEMNMTDVGKGFKKSHNVPFNTGTMRFKAKNPDDTSDMHDTSTTMDSDMTKYKFTGAFGGGFRGGLKIDSRLESGKVAPFGSKVNRWMKGNKNELGPGDYQYSGNFEKRSYNILFV